ncbi:MAG: hypothetical protein AB7E52_02375 [Bdellovibrionales bacterium]
MAETVLNPKQSQEMLLMDQLQRLNSRRAGRLAVHLHFSKLSRAYNNPSFIRIATDSFSLLISGFEGQLFRLSNKDVIFIATNVTETMLEAVIDRIKILFSQEPLLETYTIKGQTRFYTFYDLEKDFDELLKTVAELTKESGMYSVNRAEPSLPPQPQPIYPDILSKLEQSLNNVDVTNIARRQTVCTLIDDSHPQPLFEEIYISITDLQNIVAPGIDLNGNIWLFRYLTKTLDQRLMLMLMRDGVPSDRPFSLNLNVETILTPEFAQFEASIVPQLKGRLVIEMNKLDIFSDMGAFMFARDYLHDHGFRLCMDGLTHHTLPYFNRIKLGFDLLKLYWSPNALDNILPSMIPEVRNIVMETGQAHTILCRCDDEKAIQMGQELGIVMFQGRQVDKLLTAARIPMQTRFMS